MGIYHFSALSERGACVSGEQAAASEEALREELTGKGLLVQQVRAKRGGFARASRQRVQPHAFALFNQEFMALVRAGLTIPDSLALASKRPDAPALGRTLASVNEEVRRGRLMSEACARYPEVFERMYLAALRTGEKTGDLANALARYQDYLRRRVVLRKKLSQALAYPIFLLIALAIVLTVLFVFVMPRFLTIYTDLGSELPWPTRILLGALEHAYVVVPVIAGVATVFTWGWVRLTATAAGRVSVDRVKLRIPYLGELVSLSTSAQLARSLSALLSGGTALVEALRTAADTMSNQIYVERLALATQRVTEGLSLAEAVRNTRLMPELAARMIQVGEASGGLDAMFAEVAQYYEELLDDRLTRVMTLIEPLLMLLMGTLVGGIIIVMYLPVFHMADVIR